MARLMDLFPPLPGFGGDLDTWVERTFAPTAPPYFAERGYPSLNIFEQGDGVIVEAELPGAKAKDIDVSVAGAEVTLAGQRKSPTQPDTTLSRRERPYGKFGRTITLPWEIDAEHVEAAFQDGVLTVRLTKSEKCRARKINVRT